MRRIVCLFCLLLLCGCAKYVGDIDVIEELKHPTKFPDIYQPEVLNIGALVAENKLKEGEKVRLVSLGETKYTSIQMMLVHGGVTVPPHLHKDHDVVMQVEKGGAIVILNGTRYYVQEGQLILVPRKTWLEVENTGKEVFVAVNVFYPPYRGEDIKFFKTKKKKKKEQRQEVGAGYSGGHSGH